MPSFKRSVEEIRAGLRTCGLVPRVPVIQGDLENCVGEYDPNPPELITIKPGLTGCELWRIVLHEYGHAFGLGHQKRGIMHYKRVTKSDKSSKEPTARQKKAWCMEIARAVLKHRSKQWRV